MKANYEDKIPQTTSEVSLGNLYDINKQLMEKEPEMSRAAIESAQEHLCTWIENLFDQKYFMLLCHELRDYTVFNVNKFNENHPAPHNKVIEVSKDIIDCMTNRGTILSIDDQEDGAWELWVRNPEGCFAYYLFPYGDAVLEY